MTKQELQHRIGRNLADLRAKRNMTQDDVAEKVGISTTHYANLECGNKSASVLTLYRLAQVLNVSTDAILQENHTDDRTLAITNALRDQPDETVRFVERLVLMCLDEMPSKTQRSESREESSVEVLL